MEFAELLQSSFREVVEGFLLPVPSFWVVQPFNEVEYPFVISSAAFGRGHNFFHIVFLALLNVVCFPDYLRGIWWGPVLTRSIGLN